MVQSERSLTPEPASSKVFGIDWTVPPILQSVQRFYDPDAERISNSIDEEIKVDRARRKAARRKEVRVMLLGQAESGKSTLQKQFRLFHSSQTLENERPSWRPVVYHNAIKAVVMIFDEVDHVYESSTDSSIIEGLQHETLDHGYIQISELRHKLHPLIAIEETLASELGNGVSITGGRKNIFVRAGWQGQVRPNGDLPTSNISDSPVSLPTIHLAATTLASTCDDVQLLWHNSLVKALLDLGRLRLQESAPFFLDNIQRIAMPDYTPSTEDILNVRLQTLGVMEHSFDISRGGNGFHLKMYDVGGARPAWVPYFDDATAIIFLAPISAYDQFLEEDPRTNRIDDSLQLFTSICSNKLLKNCHLVLLLNKADLLKKKLRAGIKVRKYITSYGNRPNKFEQVSEYFKNHFIQVHKRTDVSHRALFVHFTSMLNITETQDILVSIEDSVLRSHIAQTGLA